MNFKLSKRIKDNAIVIGIVVSVCSSIVFAFLKWGFLGVYSWLATNGHTYIVEPIFKMISYLVGLYTSWIPVWWVLILAIILYIISIALPYISRLYFLKTYKSDVINGILFQWEWARADYMPAGRDIYGYVVCKIVWLCPTCENELNHSYSSSNIGTLIACNNCYFKEFWPDKFWDDDLVIKEIIRRVRKKEWIKARARIKLDCR